MGETSFEVNSFTFNVKNFSFEVIFTKTYAMKIYNLETLLYYKILGILRGIIKKNRTDYLN